MVDRLHFTDSDEANALIAQDPLALLIGFALDQQVTVQKAFSGPLEIRERLGALDARQLATTDLEPVFRERPAIHRFPGSMAKRVQDLAAQGRSILFVGTKRQAQEAIAEEAQRCGMPYVTERWLGGLLTNFVTVRKSLDRLKELEMVANDPRQERLTKKELARLEKERVKLEKNLLGIKGMKTVPDAVFVIDTRKEAIAVQEALEFLLVGRP